MERFDLLVFETYKHKGKTRHRPWRVGKAIPSRKGGYLLFIPEGVSLTGQVVMVPEQAGLAEEASIRDMLDDYKSAADEHGL